MMIYNSISYVFIWAICRGSLVLPTPVFDRLAGEMLSAGTLQSIPIQRISKESLACLVRDLLLFCLLFLHLTTPMNKEKAHINPRLTAMAIITTSWFGNVFFAPKGSAILVCAEGPAVATYCGSEKVAIVAESTTRAEGNEGTMPGDKPFEMLITNPSEAGITTIASDRIVFSE